MNDEKKCHHGALMELTEGNMPSRVWVCLICGRRLWGAGTITVDLTSTFASTSGAS
jgi:hypothetical protein